MRLSVRRAAGSRMNSPCRNGGREPASPGDLPLQFVDPRRIHHSRAVLLHRGTPRGEAPADRGRPRPPGQPRSGDTGQERIPRAGRTYASSLAGDLNVIKTREDFTTNMIATLEAGRDKLILADQNEEAARQLALQTRQQLQTSMLSFRQATILDIIER